jgi:hypothetical protein
MPIVLLDLLVVLLGESIDEMKMPYEQQRDKEFTSHVCAEHPRATKNPR